jgi:hypothetical protein
VFRVTLMISRKNVTVSMGANGLRGVARSDFLATDDERNVEHLSTHRVQPGL